MYKYKENRPKFCNFKPYFVITKYIQNNHKLNKFFIRVWGVKIPPSLCHCLQWFFYIIWLPAIKVEFLLLAKNLHLDSCRPDEFLTMQTTPQSAQITSDKVRQKAVLCTTKKRAFLGGFKRGYPHFGQCNI